MTLRERMKIDKELRHKARRKIRAKAKNSSPERTNLVKEKYNKRRAEVQERIAKFRRQKLEIK